MLTIAATAGWVLLAAALTGAVYAVAAAHAVEAFFKRSVPEAGRYPPITLLKPLHGAERELDQNLESFAVQNYAGAVQMVFGVQRADDTAIAVVNAFKARHPDLDIALVVSPRRDEANPKIGNLIGMMPSAKHEILVLSDSDIRVAPDYLRQLVATLEQPGVGAVTCCYRASALNNLWSKLSAMGIDYQFLPGVVVGVATGLAKPCFGSTIALSTSVLGEIGGFEAFKDRLADDYEIGNAIRARGYRVALPALAVAHSCTEESAGALLRHELRWARTIRSVDGLGYLGSVVTHALPLGLIGAICLGFAMPALAAIGVTFVARLYLKSRIDRIFGSCGQPSWLLPLRDMLSFAVFVSAFFAIRVDWRGSPYKVHPDGMLARE